MKDKEVYIQELKEMVQDFVRERDWEQYHSPKNLSMAIAIEAAELMEHFQWLTVEEAREIRKNPEKLAQVQEEIADIALYLLSLTNALNIDLSAAFLAKLEKNRAKYPKDAVRNRVPWA